MFNKKPLQGADIFLFLITFIILSCNQNGSDSGRPIELRFVDQLPEQICQPCHPGDSLKFQFKYIGGPTELEIIDVSLERRGASSGQYGGPLLDLYYFESFYFIKTDELISISWYLPDDLQPSSLENFYRITFRAETIGGGVGTTSTNLIIEDPEAD